MRCRRRAEEKVFERAGNMVSFHRRVHHFHALKAPRQVPHNRVLPVAVLAADDDDDRQMSQHNLKHLTSYHEYFSTYTLVKERFSRKSISVLVVTADPYLSIVW